MKYNRLTLIFLVIICIIFFTNIYSEFIKAKASSDLDFVSKPTYSCYKQESRKYYYHITVEIINNGDEPSDPTDIKIIEDGNSASWPDECHGVVFAPGEQKTFTLDWCTSLSVKSVVIKYMPSDAGTLEDEYNSGSETITISYNPNEDNKESPGFEFMVTLFVMMVIFMIFRMRKS